MVDLLTNNYFIYFIVPLLTTGLSIFVKIVSRNDKFISFKKEDLAIGLETAVTALIILITGTVNDLLKLKQNTKSGKSVVLPENILIIPWLLLIIVILLWGISTIIRKLGWKNENDMNKFWGIILPDILGLGLLIFVVVWISN
jgi:hypothetical protein